MILDAKNIDPDISAEQFLCQFYHLTPCTLSECRHRLYSSEEVLVTEVFNWPVDIPAWKEIAATLESVQQHSSWFYVIWGPETTDAITFEENRKQKQA